MLSLQGYVLRVLGTGVSNFTPENLVATTSASICTILLSLGRKSTVARALAVLFAVVGLVAPKLLPMLEYTHSGEGYACLPLLSGAPSAPNSVMRGDLKTEGPWFRDREGRAVILRGINVAGSSKLPTGTASFGDYTSTPPPSSPATAAATATPTAAAASTVSPPTFVGRPWPLSECDQHLSRLRAWGLTTFRFIVTWEAVEHAGPGIYDLEYLEYLKKVVRKAGEYGISIWIDPHQDVWSRWTGGDGAPQWTLDAVGFNVSRIYDSGAAITHQGYGDPYPRMMWPSNHQRLATGTMFTLFFAGRKYAPNISIGPDKTNIQDYLQTHYFAAYKKVAQVLKGEPNVIGFDTLNEPNAGLSGWKDLKVKGLFRQGWTHNWWQAMLMGEGLTQETEHYRLPFIYTGTRTLNKKGVRAWKVRT